MSCFILFTKALPNLAFELQVMHSSLFLVSARQTQWHGWLVWAAGWAARETEKIRRLSWNMGGWTRTDADATEGRPLFGISNAAAAAAGPRTVPGGRYPLQNRFPRS